MDIGVRLGTSLSGQSGVRLPKRGHRLSSEREQTYRSQCWSKPGSTQAVETPELVPWAWQPEPGEALTRSLGHCQGGKSLTYRPEAPKVTPSCLDQFSTFLDLGRTVSKSPPSCLSGSITVTMVHLLAWGTSPRRRRKELRSVECLLLCPGHGTWPMTSPDSLTFIP